MTKISLNQIIDDFDIALDKTFDMFLKVINVLSTLIFWIEILPDIDDNLHKSLIVLR